MKYDAAKVEIAQERLHVRLVGAAARDPQREERVKSSREVLAIVVVLWVFVPGLDDVTGERDGCFAMKAQRAERLEYLVQFAFELLDLVDC
jgi:hypothetical protein